MTKEKMYQMYHDLKPTNNEQAFSILAYGYIEAVKEDIHNTEDRNTQALYAKMALDAIAEMSNVVYGTKDLPRSFDFDIRYLMMYADETQPVY